MENRIVTVTSTKGSGAELVTEEFQANFVAGIWEAGGRPLYLSFAGTPYAVRVMQAGLLRGGKARWSASRSRTVTGLKFPARGDRKPYSQVLSNGSVVGTVLAPSAFVRDPGSVGDWVGGIVAAPGVRVEDITKEARVDAVGDLLLHYLIRRLKCPFPLDEEFRRRLARSLFERELVQFASPDGYGFSATYRYQTGRVVWDGVGFREVLSYEGSRADFEAAVVETVKEGAS